MSSYIVEPETINRVITFLVNDGEARYTADSLNGLLRDKGGDPASIGQAMMDLNIMAVDYRYREKNERTIHAYDPEPCDIFQALKSLRCWLYQCSEGNIPEEEELYKIMDDYADRLAYRIVSALPQYDAANWG